MEVIGWIVVVLLFAVGMLGAVFPVLPGVFAIIGAYIAYGFLISWEPFGWWFWIIQSAIAVTLIAADYAVSAIGVKKFGGTRASVIGSTIGIILGPFVIPAFGLLIGPFLGALIGELMTGAAWQQGVRAGIGAVVGFFSSVVVKVLLQALMIVLFIVWLLVN
ncbi:DUF456 domain-containing protein [Paenibacillus chartarius]|uniref:DUF456 domain-containing protein n=1 Tax=Paenibacillus chartarius TaxID=747481 RepID=A0ABV6DN14_9BACL